MPSHDSFLILHKIECIRSRRSFEKKIVLRLTLNDGLDDTCGGKSATLNSGAGELYEYPCGLANAANTKHESTINGFIVSFSNFLFAQITNNPHFEM